MESSEAPRFSIVVPVFNDEAVLASALNSILSQKHESIEIVVVDDGSSDGSLGVAQAFASNFECVSLCAHALNKGAYQARKTGVLRTKGDYVLFLDGDDELAPGSLARLDYLIAEKPVDILHFAIKVIPAAGVGESKAGNHEKWLLPFHDVIADARVIEACLMDELYCWNLCGKLIRGDICRKAFACCGEGAFSRAEDMLAYLMCAFFARSYRGAPSEYLYYYNYGAGGDGASVVALPEFKEKWLRYPEMIGEFGSFLSENASDEGMRRIYMRKFADILLRDTADSMVAVLACDEYAEALDAAIAAWGPLEIVPQIALRLWEDQGRVARDAANAALFRPLPVDPKRIAVYCSSIKTDEELEALKGVVGAWRAKGCLVGVLVDDRVDARLARGLEDVPVTILQPRYGISSGAMKLRFQALQFVLERDSVDTVVYCQWPSHAMIWDVCFLKAISLPVVLHFSAVLGHPLRKLRSYFSTQPYVHALCDGFTFDDEPARVRLRCGEAMGAQLLWARVFAMTCRSEKETLSRMVSNRVIRLARDAGQGKHDEERS